MTSGIDIRGLRLSMEISAAELARELGVVARTVVTTETHKKLQPKTESKYFAALGTIARRLAAERLRAKTEELLAIVAD
jgi:DNA-binding transcriptional regulator YiaG